MSQASVARASIRRAFATFDEKYSKITPIDVAVVVDVRVEVAAAASPRGQQRDNVITAATISIKVGEA